MRRPHPTCTIGSAADSTVFTRSTAESFCVGVGCGFSSSKLEALKMGGDVATVALGPTPFVMVAMSAQVLFIQTEIGLARAETVA
eukprot:scaffold24133_cov59-Phaeocystis_antarctica.AAC.4